MIISTEMAGVNSSPIIQELPVVAETLPESRAHCSLSMPGTSPNKPSTPKSPFVARIVTPIASPMKKAIESMQGCLEELGHFTKLDPQESWLPITESRNGNAYYAAFHTLCSGIGVQALVLPLAFTVLGWTWGIISLSLVFTWQLYTLWLLIQLHESSSGMRYSRYLWLSMATFGEHIYIKQ